MIHFVVELTNAAELLDPELFGPGALLRWESSDAPDGEWTEGGTIALDADTTAYDVWDDQSMPFWYRTRVSDAGATTFSDYTVPVFAAPLVPDTEIVDLTPDLFRAIQPTSLNDEALVPFLVAAARSVNAIAGARGPITERRRVSGDLLPLSRPALSITSVVENGITLDGDDYALSLGGTALRRLDTGTHPGRFWWRVIEVTYQPVDDAAERRRVAIALVKLDLAYSGFTAESTQTESRSHQQPYPVERQAILDSYVQSLGRGF